MTKSVNTSNLTQKYFSILCLLLGLFSSIVYAQQNSQLPELPQIQLLTDEFIFEKAPFLQCHAPTIVALKNGKLMASWFAGTHERHPDVSIYTSYLKNNTWSTPVKIADGFQNDSLSYPTWNPVLFENNKGVLFVYYKMRPSPSTWWGMYKTSTDNGIHWSNAQRLPDSILGPIKNKPIQINDEIIISPSSMETDNGEVWKAHIEISKDDGYTWKRSEIPSDSDVKLIQPSVIQLPNNILKVLLRSNKNVIMESISSDFGKSWSKAIASEVKNPNSGIDAITLNNGNFLLVYNPTLSGKDWSDGRQKLNLAYSIDGVHWKDVLQLENEKEGEFSYPAIIQDKNGFVHITYTYNRERIKYLKLKLEN
ncbi:sialidase family protein [Maribacter confluentis]|uniref:sialidase family protein n=1 Tax=Maribacter confluentis TaxID=1656093 RepID=UPI00345BE6AC